MKKISTPYYLVVGITALLWLPWLLGKGMFMDGMYNAILAQNLARGISTFWAPQTNDYSNPAYWNNPPLSMFTLSCCYKIFGDSYVIDRIYSLTCALAQLFLLAWAWKVFWRDEIEIRKYNWLPCLLFLISPLTGWCYSNNLMENTMSIFTTLSLISFLLFLRFDKYRFVYPVAGAVFIFLACLTKGPTGMFPLAIPVIFILSEKSRGWKEILSYAVLQILFCSLLFVVLFSMAAPANFLHQYFTLRLGPAISHNAKPETDTYIIFKETFIMLLPFLVLCLMLFFNRRITDESSKSGSNSSAISFILSGVAASLPIAFSTVQRKFYLLPSLPLFVLGFSILILPLVKFIEQKAELYLTEKVSAAIKYACVLIVFACLFLGIYNRNGYARDKRMLADIEGMLPLLKNEEAICADWQLYGEWSLRAYCTRYYNKKMYMPDKISETKFYLTKHGLWGDKLSPSATKIFASNTFDLYQIRK